MRLRPGATLTMALAMMAFAANGSMAATLSVCASGCDYPTISAAVSAASPGDTLSLGSEVFPRTVVIDRNLDLVGSGTNDTIIDGEAAGTTLVVNDSVTATLTDLQITGGSIDGNGGGILNNGDITLTNVLVTGNTATDGGGGIYSSGTLTLDDAWITSNTGMTDGTGSIGGGGIAISGASASLIMDNSTVSNNRLIQPGTEDRGGGGIAIKLGGVVIRDSLVTGNESGYAAGGIYAAGSGATLLMERSIVSDNLTGTFPSRNVGRGGGLFLDNGILAEIVDSTITANASKSGGGGIYADVGLDLKNSTVSGNQAIGTGGGIDADSNVFLDSVTIANNQADFGGGLFVTGSRSAFVTNLLLGDNVATTSGADCYANLNIAPGQVALIEAVDGFCTSAGGGTVITLQDPLLGPLADNGGPTPTHLPGAGSPAIDAGATNLTKDQRGQSRPQGAGDDVGAVERAGPAAPIVIEVFETITVTDTVTPLPALVIQVAETITITDTANPLPSIQIEIEETIALNDDASGKIEVDIIVINFPTLPLRPGDLFDANSGGWKPFSLVTAFLQSTPVQVGQEMADANGFVRFSITVPEDFPPGEHTLVLTGLAPDDSPRQLTTAVVISDPNLILKSDFEIDDPGF